MVCKGANMTDQNFENNKLRVGIIGAGPAGAMAAYLLASQGYNTLLLERKKETERKVCGEYLCPEGVKLLKELNLFDKLCKGFNELRGMVLVSPTGIIVPSYFPGNSKKSEKGLSLNRKQFDENILNLAVEAGACLLTDKTVTSVFKNASNKWQVNTKDENFEFDLLIAADGRQSKVGHLLGHIKTIDTRRAAIHCYLPRKIDRGQRLGEMHILSNDRYCGLDPITDDQVNFSIVCNSKLLKKETPLSIINEAISNSKRLNLMFDQVESDKQIEIKIVTSLKNKNTYLAGNNLAYIGDAAGFIDPLTGEGIYNALFSAHLLVKSINQTSNLSEALQLYKKKKWISGFQKQTLNIFFQFLIRRPFLVHLTAKYLKRSQVRANEFIGIIGNIHSPIIGFIKMLKA
jgi:flavin-dependent dehydrogenase